MVDEGISSMDRTDEDRATDWPVGDYVGHYQAFDPRTVLLKRATFTIPEGWVMVRAEEIKAVYRMRVCRATRVFDRDEDGPLTPFTAHCVEQAGHPYNHSNGYYSWPA